MIADQLQYSVKGKYGLLVMLAITYQSQQMGDGGVPGRHKCRNIADQAVS